jgi:hypothetical protein
MALTDNRKEDQTLALWLAPFSPLFPSCLSRSRFSTRAQTLLYAAPIVVELSCGLALTLYHRLQPLPFTSAATTSPAMDK